MNNNNEFFTAACLCVKFLFGYILVPMWAVITYLDEDETRRFHPWHVFASAGIGVAISSFWLLAVNLYSGPPGIVPFTLWALLVCNGFITAMLYMGAIACSILKGMLWLAECLPATDS